ncbi:hypothetical protein [Nevskia sp.]|uniref:hypothetical protein n=1 Tax=Nevskia sp. TaxID=1929292 RepID=UPI0026002632|nr:hypothetical protein [Nevskia sp.]
MDTLDAAPSPLVRLRLAGQLSTLNRDIAAMPRDAKSALARLKLNQQRRDVLAQLGTAALTPPAPENEHVRTLREIVTGAMDRIGVIDLFSRMNAAIMALNDGGLLSGDAESAADAAITHWAKLESAGG